MSFRKTVVFTTWCMFEPAASKIPLMFSSVRSVCCRMSVPMNSPVFGSSATCPDTYRNPFERMACEYGPMGLGPLSVSTTSLMVSSPSPLTASLQPFLHTARETLPARPGASSTFLQIPPHFGVFLLQTRLSDRRARSLFPAEHAAYARWLCEMFPARNGPVKRKRKGSFLREGRADPPLFAPFP